MKVQGEEEIKNDEELKEVIDDYLNGIKEDLVREYV